jgi:putative DNA primase/helicase
MASLDQIRDQLIAAGHPKLPVGHPMIKDDGKPVRYGPGKKHWYSIHEVVKDGHVEGYIGAFGMWSGDDSGAQAFAWQGTALSADEVAAAKQAQQDSARREAEQRARSAKNAANRARQQWSEAAREGGSDYLTRKQITAETVRYGADGDMFVPMMQYSADPKMVGLQKISPAGAKRYSKGMDKIGAACRLGDVEAADRVAMLFEGYATGRSIRMATGNLIAGFVCFDAGNLLPAARLIRALYPDLHLLVCADDDAQILQRRQEFMQKEYGTPGDELATAPLSFTVKGVVHCVTQQIVVEYGVQSIELHITVGDAERHPRRFENAGLKRAYELVAEIGNASVVFPRFANRGGRKLTDFNDLHVEEGLHIVKAQIEAGLLAALAPRPDDVVPLGQLRAVDAGDDPLYEDAVGVVRSLRRASISALQREMQIGHNRAARLLEVMEDRGVVSPMRDNGTRAIIDPDAPTQDEPAPAAGDKPKRAKSGATKATDEKRWQAKLRRAERSFAILPALDNVFAILANDVRWKGVLGFEEFSHRVMKLKPPPFPGGELGEWNDRDDARAVLWLGQEYQFSPHTDVIANAVFLVADRRRYHVVKDYLGGLQWDRTPRLRTWCIDYLGAADTEYVRLVGYKYLMGAVGRVMRPGCKMDNVLILEGKQDAGKSAAFKTLFQAQWFTEANFQIGDKDGYAVMAGKWVIELAELDALSKSDSSTSKRFFTTAVDTYRPPYARRAIDVPRQLVFAGSVNFDTYLKDESGNRRYWPIRTADTLLLRELAEARDQIWAEAYGEYMEWELANEQAGGVLPAPWQVLSNEKPLFELEQYARYEGDVYENVIRRYLVSRPRVTMEDILQSCLNLEISKWTPAEQRRIGKALKSIGWVRKRDSTGTRDWYYTAPDPVAIEAPFAATAVREPGDDDEPI